MFGRPSVKHQTGPPACLPIILSKVAEKEKDTASGKQTFEQRIDLNEKLMNSLYLSEFDLDEHEAALNSAGMKVYERKADELLTKRKLKLLSARGDRKSDSDENGLRKAKWKELSLDGFGRDTASEVDPAKGDGPPDCLPVMLVSSRGRRSEALTPVRGKLERMISRTRSRAGTPSTAGRGSEPAADSIPLSRMSRGRGSDSRTASRPSSSSYTRAETDIDEDKYFGLGAREDFFAKYKQLKNHRLVYRGDEAELRNHIMSGAYTESACKDQMIAEELRQYTATSADSHPILVDREWGNSLSNAVSLGPSVLANVDIFSAVDENAMCATAEHYYAVPRKKSQKQRAKTSVAYRASMLSGRASTAGVAGPATSRKEVERSASRDVSEDSNIASANKMTLKFDPKLDEKNGHIQTYSNVVKPSGVRQSAEPKCSPRTKFLGGCIDMGFQPMANLILRKNLQTTINLSHFGIGDQLGNLLADCLGELPAVECCLLCDNNLSDESLPKLITCMEDMPNLTELDISRNKIDTATSDALASLLVNESTPLLKLVLQGADVDDHECNRFVGCLNDHPQLQELDLSNNLLGSAENQMAMGQQVVTGGQSLATFLSGRSCRLHTLKLAWNSIRQQSALEFAKAIAVNSTLTYLDLSYNALGREASETLGDSLQSNKTLKTLLLANTNITGSACFTICAGVIENYSMQCLNLDSNPIGVGGAASLMRIPITIGGRVTISAKNCNTSLRDSACWFDPSAPTGEFLLKLDKPFERAVAMTLLDIVAKHSTLVLAKSSFESPSGKQQRLRLVQAKSHRQEEQLDDTAKEIIQQFKKIHEVTSQGERAGQLFDDADTAGAGELPRDSVMEILDTLGLLNCMPTEKVLDLLTSLRVSEAQSMHREDFITFLHRQSKQVIERINDVTESNFFAMSDKPKEKFRPPRSGKLRLTVVDSLIAKAGCSVMTAIEQEQAVSMSKSLGDAMQLSYCVHNIKLKFNEATEIYKAMSMECGNMALSLMNVLPRMRFACEARQLIYKVTGGDPAVMYSLRRSMGAVLRPILGMYNGYYRLDLSKDADRLCLQLLLEHSTAVYPIDTSMRPGSRSAGRGKGKASVKAKRSSREMSEEQFLSTEFHITSQRGQRSCFRNERMNNEPFEITLAALSPIPKFGVLQFDFSSKPRHEANRSLSDVTLSDARVIAVLRQIGALSAAEEISARERLCQLGEDCLKSAGAGGVGCSMHKSSSRRAHTISVKVDLFYENLSTRALQHLESEALETVTTAGTRAGSKNHHAVNAESESKDLQSGSLESHSIATEVSTARGDSYEDDVVQPTSDGGAGAEETSIAVADALHSPSDTNAVEAVLAGDERSQKAPEDTPIDASTSEGDKNADDPVKSSADSVAQDASESPPTPTPADCERVDMKWRWLRDLILASDNDQGMTEQARASRICETFIDVFASVRIRAHHLAFLVGCFIQGKIRKTKYFGTYIVDLVVSLFLRLVDPQNFDVVLAALSATEAACVFARLGYLNVFNTCKPEGCIELNLDRYEERLLAKMMCTLNHDERGENLIGITFQWKRSSDPLPGWTIQPAWLTPEFPDHGILQLQYSTETANTEGHADVSANASTERSGGSTAPLTRKALTYLLLVDEHDFSDEDISDVTKINSALEHFRKNPTLWSNYLLLK